MSNPLVPPFVVGHGGFGQDRRQVDFRTEVERLVDVPESATFFEKWEDCTWKGVRISRHEGKWTVYFKASTYTSQFSEIVVRVSESTLEAALDSAQEEWLLLRKYAGKIAPNDIRRKAAVEPQKETP